MTVSCPALEPEQWYLPTELELYLRVPRKTLAHWRGRGGGPPYLKLPNGQIRYRGRDVLEWERTRSRRTTSDTPPALTEVRQDVRGVLHVRTIREKRR